MMKKFAAVLCIISLLLTCCVPVYCAQASYIIIEDRKEKLTTAPVQNGNTVYYPIGEISKKLQMTVAADSNGAKITVSVNGHSMEFNAGSDSATVDMVQVPAKSPFVRNGDIMVEESFFTEYMKYLEFPCVLSETLNFTSIPEIIPSAERETEEEFYSKLKTDGELISENQLFSAAVIGGAKISVQSVSADDLDGYDTALKVTTLNEPTAVYDYQLKMTPKADLPQGRFGLVMYYAKALETSDESGYAYAGPCYEQKTGAHTKAGSTNHEITQDGWSKHYLLLSANSLDYTKDGSQFNMRFGYKPQSVLITGLKAVLLDAGYTKEDVTYNKTESNTYFGRGENALWRDEAFKRIEKYRKKNISVTVTDKDGVPLENVSIKAHQQKNEFMFGTAVHNNLLQASTAENASEKSKKYAECVGKYFNTVVFDTAGKWNTIEKNRAVYATGIYNWANARNINVRGHALLWDNYSYYSDSFNEAWQYMTNEERFTRVDEHINENMTYFGNTILQWDLLNEPLANRNLINRIGFEKTAQLFNTAKKAAPEVSLYINETGINGSNSNWQQVKKLRSFTENLKQSGAAIDGIGIQAHCGGALRYPQEFYNQLDYLAEAVDEIAVTEYDFNVTDEQLAADNLRDMLIAAYSHPKCTGFLTWGFWDGQHWQNNAPFFDINWNEKKALAVWDNYVNHEWKTDADGLTNENGRYVFSGHKGEYELTVTYNGMTATADFDTNSSGTVNVIIGNTITIEPDSIPQTKASLLAKNYLKRRTDIKTGETVSAYQLPEEYDKSIIAGKNAGIAGVLAADDFESYGTDGKNENGKYVNPVTDENIWGQWYNTEASQKRGTVLTEQDGRLCLAFYRQNNPLVLKSRISRMLRANCFELDTSETGYNFNACFQIPKGDKSVGIRSGRYAEFALGKTADDTGKAFAGVYSNTVNTEKPILKYADGGQITLKENTWYNLSLSLVPDGMGGVLIGGTLQYDGNTVQLEKRNMAIGNGLRFLNMTVNCYTSEIYTRSVFYLDSIEFKEAGYTAPIEFDGKNVTFNGEASQIVAAAVYDKESGQLETVRLKETADGEPTVIALEKELGEKNIMRAFLWRKTMQPAAYAQYGQ